MQRSASSNQSLFVCAAAGIAAYGTAFACLGAAFGATTIRAQIHASLQQQGWVFFLLYFGVLVSNLTIGGFIRRFGIKAMIVVNDLTLITALIWFSYLHSLKAAEASAFLLGFGGGSINVAVNALVSDIFPERRAAKLNLLGVFFGLGALFTPLFSTTATTIGVHTFFLAVAILPTCSLLICCALRMPEAKSEINREPLRQWIVDQRSSLAAIAGILFFENGNEAMLAAWTASITLARGFGRQAATTILTIYWLALMFGRLAAALGLFRFTKTTVIRGGATVALLGGVLLLAGKSVIFIAMGAAIVGFASAPIFKTTLSMAGDMLSGSSSRLFGPLFAFSLVAAAGAPLIAGKLAQAYRPEAAFFVPIFGIAGILILSWRLPAPRKTA